MMKHSKSTIAVTVFVLPLLEGLQALNGLSLDIYNMPRSKTTLLGRPDKLSGHRVNIAL
jgi:hypothetical protein